MKLRKKLRLGAKNGEIITTKDPKIVPALKDNNKENLENRAKNYFLEFET